MTNDQLRITVGQAATLPLDFRLRGNDPREITLRYLTGQAKLSINSLN